MCGRTALYLDPGDIRQNIHVENWQDEERYRKSYNVCPTRYQPVIIQPPDASLPPHLVSMKWGLIPAWKKTGSGSTQVLVNARDDSLLGNKPMFNGLKQRKRCAVLAQGKGKDKNPHYVKRSDGNLMIFAALYDEAKIDGVPTLTYTIITTTAPPKLAFLHDRMPVRLDTDSKALKIWLDPKIGWTQQVADTLRSIDEGVQVDPTRSRDEILFGCRYPVSPAVGKVGNDTPDLVEPLAKNAQRPLFFPKAKILDEKRKDQAVGNEKQGGSIEADNPSQSESTQIPIDTFCESKPGSGDTPRRQGAKRKKGHDEEKNNPAGIDKDSITVGNATTAGVEGLDKKNVITAGGDDKLKISQKSKPSPGKSKKQKTENGKITSFFKCPAP